MAQLAERGVRSDSGTSLRMPQGLPGEFSLPVRIDASALFGRSVYRCRRGSIPHVSGQSRNEGKAEGLAEGEVKEKYASARRALAQDLPVEVAAKVADLPVDIVRKIAEQERGKSGSSL